MENSPLKILLISADEAFAHVVVELLGRTALAEVTVEPAADAGLAMASTVNFNAVLFEIPTANSAALFQITSLTARAPSLPVVVVGPGEDVTFLAEVVFSGAQDYVGREKLEAQTLWHAIHCSIARQQERLALVDEKENYYGIFDHLVEGIFRTTTGGHYLLANIALARIYGYDSPVELMASIKDIANRLYVEHGRREEFVRLMQENDTLSGFESKIYRKDGTIIWIAENCRAVRDGQGRLLYYEGTVEDITDRKRAEEQIRRATGELSRSREELRTKNAVMEENLRTAREIQLTMLPQSYPCFPPGATLEASAFQFVHRYEPAESVSGDFFSVTALSDTEVGVFICDVTGHGVRAALVTAMIRALAEELKPLAPRPRRFPAQAQLRPLLHPQEHRLAHAHHRVLRRGRLPHRRAALRQCRPSQAAAHPARRRPHRPPRQRLRPQPARAGPVRRPAVCHQRDHPGAGRFPDAIHRRAV